MLAVLKNALTRNRGSMHVYMYCIYAISISHAFSKLSDLLYSNIVTLHRIDSGF